MRKITGVMLLLGIWVSGAGSLYSQEDGARREPVDDLAMALESQADREFDKAQKSFERYIAGLPEKEQEAFRDISLVASKAELDLYKSTSEEEREAVIRRFWNSRDPAPLTAANERLVEHYRRVAFARKMYSKGKFPWDTRGDVYIRLGPPDHISSSRDFRAEMERYLQDARVNFANRLRFAPEIQPGYPMFPVRRDVRWEYWVYAGLNGGTEITFVNEFPNGRYTYAPMPMGLAPSVMSDLMDAHGEVVVDRIAAREPSIYRPDFADLPIDFYYYPADYRGEKSGETRLEIYYGLPASEVARLKVEETTDLIVLDRGVALYDSLWHEVLRVSDQLAFEAPTNQQILEGAFIPGVLPVDLAPGPYHMSLQVRDVLSGKSQVYAQEIRLEDYTPRDRLQMSDLELAFFVSEADAPGEYVKHGLRVIPMSSKSFRKDQHAFVYFEIYNLTRDTFGQTRYRVEYTIRSFENRSAPAKILHGIGRVLRLAEKDQEIVIGVDQTGGAEVERTYVELDLTETEPGGQRVGVEVTDVLTEERVSKDITFQIVPR